MLRSKSSNAGLDAEVGTSGSGGEALQICGRASIVIGASGGPRVWREASRDASSVGEFPGPGERRGSGMTAQRNTNELTFCHVSLYAGLRRVWSSCGRVHDFVSAAKKQDLPIGGAPEPLRSYKFLLAELDTSTGRVTNCNSKAGFINQAVPDGVS
ncbi:uncharacterized protein LOC134537960 [Bacillus rossius redtenbacheri]|uniref:uncharacterized protein LOC134537960 n=1 Tax=Bacillus rossius redtenbacheri TaxID=93214 RepID=UPI002FDE6759